MILTEEILQKEVIQMELWSISKFRPTVEKEDQKIKKKEKGNKEKISDKKSRKL